MTDTQKKHWIFFSLMILGAILVFFGVFFLIWTDMTIEEKDLGVKLLDRVFIYSTLALVVGFFISSQFIKYIFRNYISPIDKLTEETRLIAVANSKYRIQPRGALETHNLTQVINELADSYLSLKLDVRKIIEQGKEEQHEEKRRLEVLMSQIPQGVIVCNYDGRVLLYNQKANDILEKYREKGLEKNSGLLGLGRSIFGILYRHPLIQSLNYLQNRILEGESNPFFNFITTRFDKQFLQINMAPILGLEKDDYSISGYILTLADITDEIEKKSERDIFLQTLTLRLQEELGNIQKSTKNLEQSLERKNEKSLTELDSINSSIDALTENIDHVALQHRNRLEEPDEREHILGKELLSILKEDIRIQFGLHTSESINEEIWLNISSYSVIRGVIYLIGQLVKNININKVHIELTKEDKASYLYVQWDGGEVEINTVEEWKQCPLMVRNKNKNLYSLESLVIPDTTLLEIGSNEKINRVKFKLRQEEREKIKVQASAKNSRPVYYDLELFNQEIRQTELDNIKLRDLTYTVFDTETTGLAPSDGDEIISIGAVRIIDGKLKSEEIFDQFVNPRRNIPLVSLKIHEIYPEMLKDMPPIEKVLPQFYRYAEDGVLIAHNAAFDMKFLELKEEQTGIRFGNPVLDTLLLSSVCHPNQELHNLEDVAQRLGVDIIGRHTALGDALVTAEVFLKLIPILEAKGIFTLRQAIEASYQTEHSKINF